MNSLKRYWPIVTGAIFITLFSCNTRNKKEEIEFSMRIYDRLMLKMDADSIAMLYAPDGNLDDMAHGRDSIKKFLSEFADVKIVSFSSSSNKIEINNDTALQSGRYNQVVLINDVDTMKPKGSYIAKWIWLKKEGWRIKKMTTTPDDQ